MISFAGLTVWAVLVPSRWPTPRSPASRRRRPVRRSAGAASVRPVRQLPAPGRRPDVGDGGAVGGGGGRSSATGGPDDLAAFTAALAIVTGVFALVAGLLRLGFLANFISEPVLKGFIIGLALTIIIGQVPKLFGVDKGRGRLLRASSGTSCATLGDTQGGTLVVGACRSPSCSGCDAARRSCPASLVAVIFGVVAVKVFDLDQHGVAIVGHIDSGLAVDRPADGLGPSDYFDPSASAAGIMLVGFAEGLGAAKTYAARHHYDIDANRELIGLGAANLGAGLCQRHGRQRQPVEDRGQRRRGRPLAGLGVWSSRS